MEVTQVIWKWLVSTQCMENSHCVKLLHSPHGEKQGWDMKGMCSASLCLCGDGFLLLCSLLSSKLAENRGWHIAVRLQGTSDEMHCLFLIFSQFCDFSSPLYFYLKAVTSGFQRSPILD